jgi:hypothetical protein
MRTKISKESFLTLRGYELDQELIRLPILQVRGQSLEKKKQVYETLTPGQKSLFAFWVMYGHTQMGWLQFYLSGSYIGGYEQFLPMIKAGLKHIDDTAMLENVMEAEKLYRAYQADLRASQTPAEEHPVSQVDLEKIKQEFSKVDERLFPLLGKIMEKTEQYIRASPEEFIVFESENS